MFVILKETSDNTAKEEKSIHPEKAIDNVLSIFLQTFATDVVTKIEL